MKRFSLGFMNSISSSFEVEISSDDSSTNGSIDSGSYSTTDEDHRSASCIRLGTSAYNTSEYSSKQNESLNASSMDYDDSFSTTGTSSGRDQVSKLPDNLGKGYTPKRTSSEFSACSASSAKSISSSVSNFLTAVDKTVDVVVDALIPLEDNEDNIGSKRSKYQPPPQSTKVQPNAIKKVMSLTKLRSYNTNKIDSENGSVLSRRSSTSTSSHKRNFFKRSDKDLNKNQSKRQLFGGTAVMAASSSKRDADDTSAKSEGTRTIWSKGFKKSGKDSSVAHNHNDDSSLSVNSAFRFKSMKKNDKRNKRNVGPRKSSRFHMRKGQEQKVESRNDDDVNSFKRALRLNKKKEKEVIDGRNNDNEDDSVFDYFKSMFAGDVESPSEEESKIDEKRRRFQFRKKSKKNELDGNRSLLRKKKKKKGYGFISNE